MPAPDEECRWCGNVHDKLCPYVKALEFEQDVNGAERVSRVEFLTPSDFPRKPEREDGEDYPRLGSKGSG